MTSKFGIFKIVAMDVLVPATDHHAKSDSTTETINSLCRIVTCSDYEDAVDHLKKMKSDKYVSGEYAIIEVFTI